LFCAIIEVGVEFIAENTQQIALALDATTIGNKFVVLSLNILLAGSGIPIAWCVVKANQPVALETTLAKVNQCCDRCNWQRLSSASHG
jgi:hypothetical protein